MKIFTLTLNPAFDIHAHISHFEKHAENLATVTDRDVGGKGVNISRALRVLGYDSTALVAVGEENGEEFCRALAADGMPYHAFSLAGRIRENLTLHEDGAPETRISFGGLAADGSLLAAVQDYLAACVAAGDVITLTGRLPNGLATEEVTAFLLRMQEQGARVVIDSRSFGLAEMMNAHPFLIKPNEEEARGYLGKEITSPQEAADGALCLQRAGVENVIISLGKEGAVLACSKGVFHATPPAICAVSTVGAGDSSIAGFLAALSDGKSKADALCMAVACGTAACLQNGTRPPALADVARILPAVKIKRL